MVKSQDLRQAGDAHEAVEIDGGTGVISAISKAELDQRIETAHRYPRSITRFRREALDMATIDEDTARECIYSLPRKEWNRDTGQYETKMITGPSVRMAEILISAWGNTRAGARVIEEGKEFVVAQGMFHDLEKNTEMQFEVRRRITNRNGERFSADMIATTANAACSVGLRNAVTRGIPKALWAGIEKEVRRVIAGDAKTMGSRRDEVMKRLNLMGISNDRIFAALNIGGISDIGLDEIVTLNGLGNAIRESEISIDEAFPPVIHGQQGQQKQTATQQQPKKPAAEQTKQPEDDKKSPEQPEKVQGKVSEEQAAAQADAAQKEALARVQTEAFKEHQAKEAEKAREALPPAQTAKFDDDKQPNLASGEEGADGKPTFMEVINAISKATNPAVIKETIIPMIDEVPNKAHQKMLHDSAAQKIKALEEAAGVNAATTQPTSATTRRRNTEMN